MYRLAWSLISMVGMVSVVSVVGVVGLIDVVAYVDLECLNLLKPTVFVGLKKINIESRNNKFF